MKHSLRYILPAVVGGALAVSASATTVVRHVDPNVVRIQVSDPIHVRIEKGEKSEKQLPVEKVTFLGVETGPLPEVLASQLGLGDGMGLVVRRVAEDSPAVGVLKEHDVLTKLGDQQLVDSRQLSVLIRAKKPGDEVKLTLVRGGKEMTVTAKLAERELPRMFGFRGGDVDGGAFQFFQGDGPAVERLRELPGIARDELNDVLRIIGRERGNWFAGPRVHMVKRHGGSSLLNMAEGNFAYSDDDGSIEVTASKGQRELTMKDAKGNVTFKGPINTDDERAKLPAEVKKRLGKIDDASIDFEADESLEQEGAAVKPDKTKTGTTIRRSIRLQPSF
ncbi:MAG: PDZ domain-containing protein [Candidatus Didemnitutus sp.]|nr:PDZ domain-containing protein [Candidatus Didemnitutus sp.]